MVLLMDFDKHSPQRLAFGPRQSHHCLPQSLQPTRKCWISDLCWEGKASITVTHSVHLQRHLLQTAKHMFKNIFRSRRSASL